MGQQVGQALLAGGDELLQRGLAPAAPEAA
jgi:hypothetical protein